MKTFMLCLQRAMHLAPRPSSVRLGAAIVIFGLLFALPVRADITSVDNGDWFDEDTWENQFGNPDVPSATNESFVRIRDGFEVSITGGEAAFKNTLSVGFRSSTEDPDFGGSLEVTGGSLDGFLIRVGEGGIGNLELGGTGEITVSNFIRIGDKIGGEGFFTMTGGTLNTRLFEVGGIAARGTGNISGGVINVNSSASPTGQFVVGADSGSGTLSMTGGTLNVLNGADAVFARGDSTFADATVNVDGDFLVRNGATTINDGTIININETLIVSTASGSEERGLFINGGTINALADGVFLGDGEVHEGNVVMTGGTLNTGATGTGTSLALGNNGSTATFTFSGGTINLAENSQVRVGVSGNATLTMEESVSLEVPTFLELGSLADSSGALVLNDSASLGVGTSIAAGRSTGASGSIEINNGAELTVTNQVQLGEATDATGMLTMTGGSLTTTTGQLQVGLNGDGQAHLSGLSQAVIAGTVFLGIHDGASGFLGLSEDASLITDSFLILGLDMGSEGTLEMTGGSLQLGNDLRIGSAGTGIAIITSDMDNPATITALDDFSIGHDGGGFGEFKLGGSHTEMTVAGDALIGSGNESSGSLNLSGAATLDIAGDLTVGLGEASTANLMIADGAELRVVGDVVLGDFGTDGIETSLDISGGRFEFANIDIDGDSTVTISGGELVMEDGFFSAGSSTTEGMTTSITQIGGTLTLGVEGGLGDLSINSEGGSTTYALQGGTINATGLEMSIEDEGAVALFAQSGGDMTVDGTIFNNGQHVVSGGTLNAETMVVGTVFDFGGGDIFIVPGDYRQSGGEVEIGVTGFLAGNMELTGGSFASEQTVLVQGTTLEVGGNAEVSLGEVKGSLEEEIAGGSLGIQEGFTGTIEVTEALLMDISGSGSIAGDNVTVAGELAPGYSAGLLTFDSDLLLTETSLLSIELGGTDFGVTYDGIDVNGSVLLDGDLEIWLLGGFTPSDSDIFTILLSDELSGTFVDLPSGSLIQAFGLEEVFIGSFTLYYGSGSPFDENNVTLTEFAPVPEVEVYALFISLTVMGLALWRRRA